MVRIEGFADSVRHRLDSLKEALRDFGIPERLEGELSAGSWRALRDLAGLAAPSDAVVWRVSVKPSDAPHVAAAVRTALDCRIVYDWGGGLLSIACQAPAETGATPIRTAVASVGGHATIWRAPDDVRLATDVFDRPTEPVMALTRKLKAAFDPAGILDPGRLYPGV
jgi:glycolate oxidase FAD binding subunit